MSFSLQRHDFAFDATCVLYPGEKCAKAVSALIAATMRYRIRIVDDVQVYFVFFGVSEQGFKESYKFAADILDCVTISDEKADEVWKTILDNSFDWNAIVASRDYYGETDRGVFFFEAYEFYEYPDGARTESLRCSALLDAMRFARVEHCKPDGRLIVEYEPVAKTSFKERWDNLGDKGGFENWEDAWTKLLESASEIILS